MVLFDKWVGTYTIYPTLSWYHAVAFSKKSQGPCSMEISNYDDWENRMDDPLEREWITEQIQMEHDEETLNDQINAINDTLLDLKRKMEEVEDAISKLTADIKDMSDKREEASTVVTVAREEVVCITNDQWSSVIESENVSVALEMSMCAVLTLFGYQEVMTWSSARDVLQEENANILNRIIDFSYKLEDIIPDYFTEAEKLLDVEVDVEEGGGSAGSEEMDKMAEILSGWVNAHTGYSRMSVIHEEIGSERAIKKVEREDIKVHIKVAEDRKKSIKSQWQRSLSRKQEYEWIDAQRMEDRDEEEEKLSEVSEAKVSKEVGYVPSIKNYVTIQCEDDLIGIHPTNPTFALLNVAPVKFGKAFCNSRMYGSFFLTHGCKAIGQSPRWNAKDVHLLYRCDQKHERWNNCFAMDQSDDFKSDDIQQFASLTYDEGFGPSGRLLAYCETSSGHHRLCQFLNQNELKVLEESLWKCGFIRPRNPGTDTKPLWTYGNTTICIFEMLYGSDMVELVLERYEEKRAKLEDQKKKEEEIEALAPGADENTLDGDTGDVDDFVAVAEEEGDSLSFEIVNHDEGEGM